MRTKLTFVRRGDWIEIHCSECGLMHEEQWTFYADTISEYKRTARTAHICPS